jgi:hypothetical protein
LEAQKNTGVPAEEVGSLAKKQKTGHWGSRIDLRPDAHRPLSIGLTTGDSPPGFGWGSESEEEGYAVVVLQIPETRQLREKKLQTESVVALKKWRLYDRQLDWAPFLKSADVPQQKSAVLSLTVVPKSTMNAPSPVVITSKSAAVDLWKQMSWSCTDRYWLRRRHNSRLETSLNLVTCLGWTWLILLPWIGSTIFRSWSRQRVCDGLIVLTFWNRQCTLGDGDYINCSWILELFMNSSWTSSKKIGNIWIFPSNLNTFEQFMNSSWTGSKNKIDLKSMSFWSHHHFYCRLGHFPVPSGWRMGGLPEPIRVCHPSTDRTTVESFLFRGFCLLWIEKARATDNTYEWGSVWWETNS